MLMHLLAQALPTTQPVVQVLPIAPVPGSAWTPAEVSNLVLVIFASAGAVFSYLKTCRSSEAGKNALTAAQGMVQTVQAVQQTIDVVHSQVAQNSTGLAAVLSALPKILDPFADSVSGQKTPLPPDSLGHNAKIDEAMQALRPAVKPAKSKPAGAKSAAAGRKNPYV